MPANSSHFALDQKTNFCLSWWEEVYAVHTLKLAWSDPKANIKAILLAEDVPINVNNVISSSSVTTNYGTRGLLNLPEKSSGTCEQSCSFISTLTCLL